MAQEKLTEALEIDLQELRTKDGAAEYEPVVAVADPASEEKVKPAQRTTRPSLVYRRVHRTYQDPPQKGGRLSLHSTGRAGARAQHCNKLPWEGVLEVVSAKKRERRP